MIRRPHPMILIALAMFLTFSRSALRAQIPDDLLGEYSETLIDESRRAARAKPSDAGAQITLGKYLARKYNITGESELRREADAALDRALEASPGNAEAMAFKGMLICIDAREKESQPLGKEGLAILDKATSADPDNLTVLYTNATVSIEVPKRWGRLDTAADRMHQVEEKVSASPDLAQQYDIGMQNVYYKLGKVYQERRDFDKAVSYWKKAVEIGPKSRYGKKAKRLVERYGGPSSSAPLWRPGASN